MSPRAYLRVVTPRTPSPSGVVPDRVIRMKEVCQIVGLSKSMVFELAAAGKFPERIRLTDRAVGWLHSDVIAWLKSRERISA